jgi:hypothetical protein
LCRIGDYLSQVMIPPCLHADKRESNKLIHKAIYCLIGKIWLEIQTFVRFFRNRQLGINTIMTEI